MYLAVVGCGYVGLVTASCLAKSGHQVMAVEKNSERLSALMAGGCYFSEATLRTALREGIASGRLTFTGEIETALRHVDLVIITVGTPAKNDGSADLSQIEEACGLISTYACRPITVVMKSTVPPGTGLALRRRYFTGGRVPIYYASNPEFLREGSGVWDWYYPDRIVVGADQQLAVEQLLELHQNINAPKLVMDITSAEMVKYAANAFLATKISFINEIANLCECVGARIDSVVAGVSRDKRIGPHFLRPGLGYGGSCFPKDTRALYAVSSFNGYKFQLLKATISVNAQQRRTGVKKLDQMLGGLKGKVVAILGLAFKPGTDDVREAPAIDLALRLRKAGARARGHDPVAVPNARRYLPEDVFLTEDVYECLDGANGTLIATEWDDYIALDWSRIRFLMREPYVVLDGRNALDQERLLSLGFRYAGVGRSFIVPPSMSDGTRLPSRQSAVLGSAHLEQPE